MRSSGFALFAACASAAMGVDIEDVRTASTVHSTAIRTARLTGVKSEKNLGTPATLPARVAKLSRQASYMAQANRSWSRREVRVIDFTRNRWRMDAADTRDLRSLAQSIGPDVTPKDITRSGTLICGERDYYLSYHGENNALAVHSTRHGASPQVPLTTGVIPSRLFEASATIQMNPVEHEGRPCHEICVRTVSGVTAYYADAEIGLRFRTAEFSTSDERLLRRFRLSDYRVIDGVPFPFMQVEEVFDKNGKLSRESTFKVEAARFNIDVPESEFALTVPSGTAVSLLAGPAPKAFTTRSEVRLTLGSALEIFDLATGCDQAPTP